jgi:hypothetical protein
MELLIAILWMLVYAAIIAIAIYIVLWALESVIGIGLPGRVIQLIWVVFAIIVIIMVLQILLGLGGGFSLPRFDRG